MQKADAKTIFAATAGIMAAILLFGYLRWESPAETRFKQFQADIKKSLEPNRLREWAAPIVNQHDDTYTIDNKELPSWLGKIGSEGCYPDAAIVFNPIEGKVMSIMWGGGFRAWGLTVGETNLGSDDSARVNVKWVPGIYIWKEKF